jgi:pimeloyl-ACP methyl ester carboxylesterase
MPTAIVDGISTRYELVGSGPPLLMFSPGGFDATLEKWSTLGVYAKTKMLDHLSSKYQCIVFDRRETGRSGGRVERVTWLDYARQGKGLLEHLNITSAHLLGGCMGCSPVLAFAVAFPAMVNRMVLYWPVGGPRYRMSSHQRLDEHLSFVSQNGLDAVVALVKKDGKPFGADPRGGPWASVIRADNAFAEHYRGFDVGDYSRIVGGLRQTLFDRDTAPGAEPEELMRGEIATLIVPGHDASHATSAARYLEECLPRSEYWDIAVADQTETTVPPRLLRFLDGG